jgi:enoyl-[acyl-carrier-protein] reductase (NADH)
VTARGSSHAATIHAMAHDAARLITGETLCIDGGYHIID